MSQRELRERFNGKQVVLGLSSGIGNAVFCLPAIKKLYDAGARVTLYVDGDYDMTALWRRCVWAESVVDGRTEPLPEADAYISGHWCPPKMRSAPELLYARWTTEPHYPHPEWQLIPRMLGVPRRVDVSGWCRGLMRPALHYDVGLINGCKPGSVWERKRYPRMGEVAAILSQHGLSVAAIGLPADTDGLDVPVIGNVPLEALPDELVRCRMIIGIDSGQLHLASSLGVPVVALYTSVSAVKGEPVGRRFVCIRGPVPCYPCVSTPRWGQCKEWKCQEILPRRVARWAVRMLSELPA